MTKKHADRRHAPGWLAALALSATFILAPLTTALAADGNPTPLDFKPTGDALWDAYAALYRHALREFLADTVGVTLRVSWRMQDAGQLDEPVAPRFAP